ncbi:hypothetical protein GCM10022403_023420 [Streptomyces coacervatus]|uniref:HD domain-containing protein n=1 Tax=Streptomyces coacervatus TaxID=647381 RepID=A0ABP7HAJ2_9ACTN
MLRVGEEDMRLLQVAGMPELLAEAVRDLVAEYEAKESPEAICARDADKLECMIQGIVPCIEFNSTNGTPCTKIHR